MGYVSDIVSFLKKHKVKEQDYFDEYFEMGHYSTQDTRLEATYGLADGYFTTIVLDDHSYAYIDVFNDNLDQVYDGYITFNMYKRLLTKYNKKYWMNMIVVITRLIWI